MDWSVLIRPNFLEMVSSSHRNSLKTSLKTLGKSRRSRPVEDYVRRKGWDLATAERWRAPILSYDPVRAREAAAWYVFG